MGKFVLFNPKFIHKSDLVMIISRSSKVGHRKCQSQILNARLTATINKVIMVRYAATSVNPTKSAKTRGSYLRVSFKNTRETAQAINGKDLSWAITYLNHVLEHKRAVPFRGFKGSIGRTAQGKEFGTDLGIFPCELLLTTSSLAGEVEQISFGIVEKC